MQGILSKFADDTKLGGAVDCFKNRYPEERPGQSSRNLWKMLSGARQDSQGCPVQSQQLDFDNPCGSLTTPDTL